MGLMDKVKVQAEQAVAKAQQGVAQGQAKLETYQQQKHSRDALLKDLGAAYFAWARNDGPQEAINAALTAVDAADAADAAAAASDTAGTGGTVGTVGTVGAGGTGGTVGTGAPSAGPGVPAAPPAPVDVVTPPGGFSLDDL